MNPRTLDLNLLRVLDALVRERHVTRAAEQLHLSQGTVRNYLSEAIGKLGSIFFQFFGQSECGMTIAVLKRVHQDGVTADQLQSAKTYIKGQFGPTLSTSMSLLANLPIHSPGAFGTSETFWTLLLFALGVPKAVGIATGFAGHLVTIAFALVFMLYGLRLLKKKEAPA